MKKLISKTNGREFIIGDNLPNQIDGIPCFSFHEIESMKGKNYSIHELNLIFDTKLELGATVVASSSPHEDLGYDKSMPPKRSDLARDYAQRIKEMLKSNGAQTDKEKKLKP